MRYVASYVSPAKRRTLRRANARLKQLKNAATGKVVSISAKRAIPFVSLNLRAERDFLKLTDEQVARIEAICEAPPPVSDYLRGVFESPPKINTR